MAWRQLKKTLPLLLGLTVVVVLRWQPLVSAFSLVS